MYFIKTENGEKSNTMNWRINIQYSQQQSSRGILYCKVNLIQY